MLFKSFYRFFLFFCILFGQSFVVSFTFDLKTLKTYLKLLTLQTQWFVLCSNLWFTYLIWFSFKKFFSFAYFNRRILIIYLYETLSHIIDDGNILIFRFDSLFISILKFIFIEWLHKTKNWNNFDTNEWRNRFISVLLQFSVIHRRKW